MTKQEKQAMKERFIKHLRYEMNDTYEYETLPKGPAISMYEHFKPFERYANKLCTAAKVDGFDCEVSKFGSRLYFKTKVVM